MFIIDIVKQDTNIDLFLTVETFKFIGIKEVFSAEGGMMTLRGTLDYSSIQWGTLLISSVIVILRGKFGN